MLRRARSPDLRILADEDLMALVYDGDTPAFAVLFDRHAGADSPRMSSRRRS